MKDLFKIAPWLNPSDMKTISMSVPFEKIGIITKSDCDILLSMMDMDEDIESAVNATLDYRNDL